MGEDQNQDQEKTEDPTPRRLEDARKKGDVAKTKEVPAAMTMAAVLLFAIILGKDFFLSFVKMFSFLFNNINGGELYFADYMKIVHLGLRTIFPLLIGFLSVTLISAVSGHLATVGFLFTTEPLKPDLKKINPFGKFMKIFLTKDKAVDLIKNILKISVFLMLSITVIVSHRKDIFSLNKLTSPAIMLVLGRIFLEVLRNAVIFYVVIGVADWVYQKWSYTQKLKMSRQDIKDEFKNSEGDPLIKHKLKQQRRSMLSKAMQAEVKGADVVITNPTHYSVAIKYKEGVDYAPKVVAKGVDSMAFQIRKIAKNANITIMESPPLARFLYRTVKIGDEIPEEAYKAVAEILVQVYKIQGRQMRGK